MEDAPGTVFYLAPFNNNKYAAAIIRDPANRDRVTEVPHIDTDEPVLRIGLDQQPKSAPYLVRFGRRGHNDVILSNRFSRNDQCYFDFNKDTGELLLHDISEKNDTELYDIVVTYENGKKKEKPGSPQIWKTPRQCLVVLSPDPYANPGGPAVERQWIFTMRDAWFRLIPRRAPGSPNQVAFTEERLAFAGRPDPDRTLEGTLQRIITLGLQSLQSEGLTTTYKSASTITFNPHNTRFRTPLEPDQDDVIQYTKLRPLGGGGQGEVHKVVDKYNGNHHACKIVAVKSEIPEWNICSEREFRARVEMEVNLVQALRHPHIVPYTHTQGFKIGQNIEIFMPIYQASLHDLINRERPKGPAVVGAVTNRMLHNILGALDFVHTYNPQIIHRDIKPANILYQAQGDNYLLTDFGIAKVVDSSRTRVGTPSYAAPEVREYGEQTPKVDIYSLGVTVVECLAGLPAEEDRQWHQVLQKRLSEHAPRLALMLADIPDHRPTARQAVHFLPSQPALKSLPSPQNSTVNGVAAVNQANGEAMVYSAGPTPMDWTLTRATAVFQRTPRPTQHSEVVQPLQLNPRALRSPKAIHNRPSQPGIRRKGSVKSAKSTDERQKKGNRRGGSFQNLPYTPSQPAGVLKRAPSKRGQRSRSKSINKVQEKWALRVA